MYLVPSRILGKRTQELYQLVHFNLRLPIEQ